MVSKTTTNRGSRLMLCGLYALFCCGFTSAGLLNLRRDDALNAENGAIAAATGPATTDASATTTSLSLPEPAAALATAAASAVATGTEAVSMPTESAATATSNSTTITNSTNTAGAAATSVLSNPLNSTNDPHGCHITLEEEGLGNPFCKPPSGQTIQVNEQFEGKLQWDTDLFDSDSTNTIKLVFLKANGPSESDEISTLNETTVPNSQGSTFLSFPSSSLKGSTTTNVTLVLDNEDTDSSAGLRGPTLLFAKANSTSSSHSKSSGKLGEEVGIPIGLVFLIALVGLAAAYICMRRRRRGLGYGAGRKDARSQRMAAAGGTPAYASRGHKRDASFHDEPTRGMELQNRNSGLTGEDNWDWGSPVSSPTTVGGRNSNAFREEIQRQRSGKKV